MKTGRTLQELGLELQRQRSVRQDYVADSRSLSFRTDDGDSKLTMNMGEKMLEFGVNPLAHQQISTRLGIPLKYYQRMQKEAPALLDANVNVSGKAAYDMVYLAYKGGALSMSREHTSDTIDGVFMDNDNASYDATAKGFIARKVFLARISEAMRERVPQMLAGVYCR